MKIFIRIMLTWILPIALIAFVYTTKAGCETTNGMGTVTAGAVIEKYAPKKPFSPVSDQKIVLVGGCFDVLHYGHVEFLKNAKSQGHILVVALEPDEKISKFKHRKPIHNQQQRANNLSAIRYVDRVLLLPNLQGFEAYSQLVKDIHPDIIAITSDDPFMETKRTHANNIGAELVIVIDRIDGLSSSKIIGSAESRIE